MAEKVKSEGNNKNGWDNDDEDDIWDDWDDAEEITSTIETAKETQKPSKAENLHHGVIQNNNKDAKTITATESRNSNIRQELQQNLEQELEKQIQEEQGQIQETNTSSSWGLWGGKLTSVLSTATVGLGNITTSVNQGINQIIGVPDPEEMARINAAEEEETKKNKNDDKEVTTPSANNDEHTAVFGLGLVSGVTSLGSKVLNTGLDTLEGIGKKTMTILQENDPKLINKRKMLGLETEKPNLSALLQEAKQDADQIEESKRQLELEKAKAQLRFEILFENFCGLVHYEALEILSKESQLKLQKLLDAVSGNALNDLKETIEEVNELLELEDLECNSDGDYDGNELNERLEATLEDADVVIKFDDITSVWCQLKNWLETEADTADNETIYAKGITALSETCALEVCKLHKIAELLLVKEHHSTANEVDGIVQLCKQFHGHLKGLIHCFVTCLNVEKDENKLRINTLFSELLTALGQIDKSYKLFTPILQIGAI